MSRSGVNMAITQDGDSYNKLRRPDDFVASLASSISRQAELIPPSAMLSASDSSKRKRKDIETPDLIADGEPNTKRPRESHAPKAAPGSQKPFAADTRRIFRPIRDCGMQSMFPGMDDEDSSDEATQEALAYLRSVRSEASAIPKLLNAKPKVNKDELDRSMYDDGRGDYKAVYKDGTWVAVNPDTAEYLDDYWSEDSYELDPQEQHYNSLLRRYKALRNTITNADPRELATLMEANPDDYANVKPPTNKREWLHTLDHENPTPALVTQLSETDIFRGLEYCAQTVARFDSISKQKSCWIWTLLALAGESGTLDHFKVGRIRDLGQKAGQLRVRLINEARRIPRSEDKDEDVEEWDVDGEGTDGADDEDAAADESGLSEDGKFINSASEIKQAAKGERSRPDETEQSRKEDDGLFTFPNGTGNLGAQVDGTMDHEDQAPSRAMEDKKESGDSADMSMSDGEVDERNDNSKDDEATELEAARARLLAQLGDRLVQTSIPGPKIPEHQLRKGPQSRGAPRPGGRHRHNGRVCKDPTCGFNKGRQEAHRKAGIRAAQGKDVYHARSRTPPSVTRSSRAKAEQRQHTRAPEVTKAKAGETPVDADARPPPSQDTETAKTQNPEPSLAEAAVKGESSNDRDDSENKVYESIDLNTRVTIDMILTVVAEFYGQKDLLRFREVW